MSARQIAALLKSNRQDGWTNNNNNRNAHQVHNNNNVINTTMYPVIGWFDRAERSTCTVYQQF